MIKRAKLETLEVGDRVIAQFWEGSFSYNYLKKLVGVTGTVTWVSESGEETQVQFGPAHCDLYNVTRDCLRKIRKSKPMPRKTK